MASNHVTELPSKWLSFVNNKEASLYIKFVTDEVNKEETNDPTYHLHLYSLSSYIYDRMKLIANTSGQDITLIPGSSTAWMVAFPFEMNGKRLDNIAKDLLFFGLPVFGFKDDTRFMKNL